MAKKHLGNVQGLGTGLQAGQKFAGSDLIFATMSGGEEVMQRFSFLPSEVRVGIAKKIIRRSGRVMLEEQRKTVPVGAAAGGRDKQSAAYKAAHPLQKDLLSSLTTRQSSQWKSKHQAAAAGIIGVAVGPEWPHGAHAHLTEFDHAHVAWGRPAGTMRGTHWMRRAKQAAEPRIISEQQSQFPKVVDRAVAKLNRDVTSAQAKKISKLAGKEIGKRDFNKLLKAFGD